MEPATGLEPVTPALRVRVRLIHRVKFIFIEFNIDAGKKLFLVIIDLVIRIEFSLNFTPLIGCRGEKFRLGLGQSL